MGTIIVACQTIRDEVNLAIAETRVPYPVLWIESGLHNFPDRLGQKIQQEIDKIENVETILLAFGYCGNSLLDIRSSRAQLIIPRVDDCISLLLGSYERRQTMDNEIGTYFLTKGWLENEQNLVSEYERCVVRYGKEKALKVMKMMLNNYHRLMVINTQAYQSAGVLKKTKWFADVLGLSHEEIEGSSRLLKKLLLGPWDAEFAIIQAGEKVTLEHMIMINLEEQSDTPRLCVLNL
ncbi:DUF1638 domain-containing protein [Desulfosporosinus fructosivorans]|uniref:DUF1638 domain-containing protein n=1 Tax=Desulfosporosinus fructosivorans TaxID=2018669 RepID=A0A4Z0R4J5_9FIRM|nr:DUF1638 domain-containing protein [Desulfosporosinus fructosivorans]TGE37474.1 DUF1638 domain-containing protein [Desulfosporosinus fructosivorans]